MKILYLNHVCWEWIFQRPQIIELLIEKDFECAVVNKHFILGKTIANNNVMPKNGKNVWLFPKYQNFKILALLNNIIYKYYVHALVKNYDAVWICHPSLYYSIPKRFTGKIIYDCMDNHVAFKHDIKQKELLRKEEDALIKRADLVFATSNKLIDTVPGLSKAVLVRNGYLSNVAQLEIKQSVKKSNYKIGYFGTVAEWFDYGLLENSVKEFGNINYHILGPISNGLEFEQNDNILFKGTVEHSKLAKEIEDYDALIMPFTINEIILSVDPVKLYEYINFGKCIISVWYPEIERFRPFVYFYKDEEEYRALIGRLSAEGFPPKYSEEERKKFLSNNTWEARYSTIKENLKLLYDKNEKI